MKRLLAASAALLLSASMSFAQYSAFTYETPGPFKLIQIDQYDDATVFFFTIKSETGRESFCVNDNTKVVVDGEYRKYEITGTGNVPFTGENCSSYLKEAGDELNFILQFERIPLDKPFSIVEKAGVTTGHTFNFNGIKVDTSVTCDRMDIPSFLKSTDYVKTGHYSSNGNDFLYYEINGVSVAAHLREEYCGFTRIGCLDLVITNDSGRALPFTSGNVSVTAKKNERKGFVQIPLWSVSEYDSFVRINNSMAVDDYADEVNPIASGISEYRRYYSDRSKVGEQIALASAELLFRATKRDKIDEYAAELERNRQRLWDNYLETVNIGCGETYGGFVTFKDSNYKNYEIAVTVAGHTYIFHIKG